MAGPFDSAWLKWGWAVRHAQALEADLNAYADNPEPKDLYTSRTEYDAKRHCVILRLDTVKPLPPRWGLRLGDVANNFKASLDHLAWVLVHRGSVTLTTKEKRKVYFPISPSNADFNGRMNSGSLRGIRRADRAILRRYQPYARGKRGIVRHCLTPLSRIANDDKHREVRPLWGAPTGGRLEYRNPTDCEITRVPVVAPRVVLQVGAELQRIYVRKTGPNPDIYMEAHLAAKPLLNKHVWLHEWCQTTTGHVHRLLSEFASPPAEIEELGLFRVRHGKAVPFRR